MSNTKIYIFVFYSIIMKQPELKLKVKKLKEKKVKYVMDLTPKEHKQLKTIAFNLDISIKDMILQTFKIER